MKPHRLACYGISFCLFFAGFMLIGFGRSQVLSVEKIIELENEATISGSRWDDRSIRESSELFLQAAKHRENLKDLQNTARCLREAVKAKIILGEESSSIKMLLKSLDFEKKSRNAGGQAETNILLTVVSFSLGENEKSRIYHRQALIDAEKANRPEINARVFFYSAAFYLNEQDFPEMKRQLERSLETFRSLGDRLGEAEALTELAYGNALNNDRRKGRECAQMALEIATEINNVRARAFALIALGDSYYRMGELEKAVKLFFEAESIFPNNVDFNERAILINRIGFYYLAFDNLEKAKQYFLDSLLIFNKRKLTDGSSMLLTNLAQISVRQKNYAEADNYFQEARRALNNSSDLFSLTTLEADIGDYLMELGKFDLAESHLKSSLALSERLGVDYKVAEAEEKLGTFYEKKGDYTKARIRYSRSFDLNTKVINKFAEAQNLYNLARLDYTDDLLEPALFKITESVRLTETAQNETANSLLKRTHLSKVYDRYELLINLLMQSQKQSPGGDFVIRALQASEKSRSRSLLETLRLSDANFTKDANPELVRKEEETRNLLSLKADRLTELLSSRAKQSEVDKIDQERIALENELETIKADLKQQSPIYSTIKNPAPFDVAEFQRSVLDNKTLLLEFSLGDKESYLWIVGKNEVSGFVLPARNVIESRIDTLRETFESRQKIPLEDPEIYLQKLEEIENLFASESKLLSNDLLGQVAEKLADKRLIVVPDGKLALFPLSALPFPNSDEPLIAKNEIVYQPSASLLNILPNLQTHKQLPTKDLLVFADPVFSNLDNRLTAKREKEASAPDSLDTNLRDFGVVDSNGVIPRLPASQDEATSIAKTLGGSRTTILSGFDANRDFVLKSEISDYRILHFATHGLIDMNRPEVSSIVLSQFDADGNKREGFLRLQDIYALALASDLVVLSACQSGIGKDIKGEGLMSLNNAFLQAGAKSVLSSAWKVDDNATATLMSKFYSNLIDKGLTASEALRQAQIDMSKTGQFKSPFYWAAFTVQGEFRQPITVSSNYFSYILYGILGIVGFAIYRGFKKARRY